MAATSEQNEEITSAGEGASSDPRFTEALIDALAEMGSAKSKQIANRLGVSLLQVRQELIDLEKLGIVYRTGQTRGTRWWLG